MGLKVVFTEFFQPVNVIDKIRPKWDWKSIAVYVELYTLTEIKSDQNGIERKKRKLELRVWKTKLIKSDQNGIESRDVEYVQCLTCRIKSDQNGIERYLYNLI